MPTTSKAMRFCPSRKPLKNRTKDRFTGGEGFKVKAARMTKKGRVRRFATESGRPMPILLQKFRDMGRPALFQ